MSSDPIASIIVATYNRSYVLRYAIASVLKSEFADWEMIVVGDGCTDDTEDVVRGFADPRIRFVNLPTNSGWQSVPNNTGAAMARGRYILFLNHDDMYFPDHLSRSIAFMERERPDIAWSPVLLLRESGSENGPPDPLLDRLTIDGATASGTYEPEGFIIASSWIVERNAYHAVGPWLPPTATRLSPSQEWLYRAARQGRRLAFHRHVSVFCIHADTHRYPYLVRRSPYHDRAWTWIEAGEQGRTALLECAALDMAATLRLNDRELKLLRASGFRPYCRALLIDVMRRLGFHPFAVERALMFRSRAWLDRSRRQASEPPKLAPGETLELGSAAADLFLSRGWHPAEITGRWTAGSRGEMCFTVVPDGSEDRILELSGHPLRFPDHVTFSVNGKLALIHHFDREQPEVLRIPFKGDGSVWLSIEVKSPTSPSALGKNPDTRTLGFRLMWIRLLQADALNNAPSGPVA
jgi:glycosyltransferase involved in cell wall biosynthesis